MGTAEDRRESKPGGKIILIKVFNSSFFEVETCSINCEKSILLAMMPVDCQLVHIL